MNENELQYHESEISTDAAIFLNNQEKDPLEGNLMSSHEEKKQYKYVQKEIKVFKCNICEYETVWKGYLKQHKKSVHERIKPYICNICNYKAIEKSSLKRHIRSVHE